MLPENQKVEVLIAVEAASNRWKNAFNAGDAETCAAQYEGGAVMHARPFGTFSGSDEIQSFWQKLIEDGFSDVDYIEPSIEIIDEKSAILQSRWKMNKAQGVIYKELWVLQSDGTTKLREDDFEAQG
ncbi:MAG: nuclear transport factor 2 family protein [Cyanobacteria bacterium P01_H01_bin.15]